MGNEISRIKSSKQCKWREVMLSIKAVTSVIKYICGPHMSSSDEFFQNGA